jgi:hypothetical protein
MARFMRAIHLRASELVAKWIARTSRAMTSLDYSWFGSGNPLCAGGDQVKT